MRYPSEGSKPGETWPELGHILYEEALLAVGEPLDLAGPVGGLVDLAADVLFAPEVAKERYPLIFHFLIE